MSACDHPPVPIKIVAPHSARPFEKLVRPYATIVAFVDDKGRVMATNLDVSSGSAAYDKAAVEAMKAWTFMPAAAECQALPGESEFVVGGNDASIANACDHDVYVTRAESVDLPPIVRQSLAAVHAGVTVSVNQFGEVTKVVLSQKSGNDAMDAAALKAAMASNYLPAVKNCMPVASTYVFSADFVP